MISKLIVEKLFGTLNGKKIAILGFSFKANTNDTKIRSNKNLFELVRGRCLFIYS